ncbi:hypothetical protein TNCT_712771, partial [Trichonephila clavata]
TLPLKLCTVLNCKILEAAIN